MSYYEDRINALEVRIEEMSRLNRMKAIPVEAKLIDRIHELNKENARLRASSFVTAVPVEQYERVVKAGDLLCFHYISLARKRWPDDPLPSSVTDWNAAKEGKPSV